MSFALIDQMQRRDVPVTQSCRVLGVSRAGFYEARRRFAQPEICTDSVHVRAVFAANQQCYGSRRMVIALRKKGLKIGRYRVRRLMCQLNLKPVWKRKFVHTTDRKPRKTYCAGISCACEPRFARAKLRVLAQYLRRSLRFFEVPLSRELCNDIYPCHRAPPH